MDNIYGGDEKTPVNTVVPGAEDTALAENNEEYSDDPSPETTMADEPGEDSERLKKKLKAKARNERFLGSALAKLSKKLVSDAVLGDDDAMETIANDPEIKSYVQKKFPKEWSEIEGETKEQPEDIATKAYKIMQDKKWEDDLRDAIIRKGIKGQVEFDKIYKVAKSLKGLPVENAASAGIAAVKPARSVQPNLSGGMNTPPVNDEDFDIGLANKMGISVDDLKRYGPKVKGFKYGVDNL